MSYLKYNGQYIISGGQYMLGAEVIEGVANWDGTYYVNLSGTPDLSGNKTITWKMWMDSASIAGELFSLGADEDSISIKASTGELRCNNPNRTMGTNGEKRLATAGLYGMVLDCIAVKTSNTFTWFQIGGKASADQNLSQIGTARDISRIGAGGINSSSNPANNMYVWDVQVNGIGAWNGYGSNGNTSAAWVDTIGSNDGTMQGTPDLAVLSSTPTYTDWFMPSKDELDKMYNNLHLSAVGSFLDEPYWSSSETSATQVWGQNFPNGAQLGTINKTSTGMYLRACRSFTAGIGAYALRDTGPAGGLIFDIVGSTTYYEAAPADNVATFSGTAGLIWSNITASASGATGTAVGTGITNTPLISGQTSHEYSNADICEKYAIL